MRDDDFDFDLSAWDAPAPPAGIADAVVERMREAVAASPMTNLISYPRSRRWWWIAGAGVAVAAVAAIAIIVFGGSRPEVGHGSVSAARAQHLDLGGVTGDLDPGVELTWDRDATGVHIAQRRGVAMWKVADEHLVIDAGAAVASVEASGASLRVEVQMNQSDARLIGVSGATAAAVALVTVIVYEGHIKAGSGGQTTVVAAGETWNTPGKEQTTVGANTPAPAPATDERARLEMDCFQAKADKKWQELLDCARRLVPLDGNPARELAEVAKREMRAEIALQKLRDALQNHDAVAAKQGADSIPEDSVYKVEANQLVASIGGGAPACDADALRTKGTEFVNMGQYGAGLTQFLKALKCDPSSLAIRRLAFMSACQAGDANRARELFQLIPPAQGQGLAQICRRNNIDLAQPASVAGCDLDKLRGRALDAEQHNDYAGAIAAYEASLQCKHDDAVVVQAYFAACNDRNAGKARAFFDDMSSWDQAILAPYCAPLVSLHPRASNVDVCVPTTLNALGSAYIRQGQYGAALTQLKKSLGCTGGDTVQTLKLAYMAACQATDAASARTYYHRIPAAQRGAIAQICLRNKINPDAPAPASPPTPPPSNDAPVPTSSVPCDVDELRTKGTEYVNKGQYGAALTQFKKAMACPGGNNLAIIRLAFLSACQAGDAASARSLFALIPPSQQNGVQMICMRNHIDPTSK